MTASAQGIDVSSYQTVLTRAQLEGLSFAFAKATEGPSGTDPNFAPNWAVLKSAGIHRGTYHELWPSASSSPQSQAAHFLAVVKAQGLEPGDMLAVVASDYQGVSDAEVKAFCDEVKGAAPRCPVLVYSDLSVARTLPSCTGYALWAAWPSPVAPASVKPWETWKFWQWDETSLDRNAFNGTAAELSAWIDSIANPVPPADWTYGPPQHLDVTPGHTNFDATWSPPAGAPETPAFYRAWVYEGKTCTTATLVATYPRTETGPRTNPDPGNLKRHTLYTLHVSAFAKDGTHAKPGVYASAVFTTG